MYACADKRVEAGAAGQDRERAVMATSRLSGLEQAAWEGFLRTHERLWRAMEAGLARVNVSMAEYSVLALLGEGGRRGCACRTSPSSA